MSQETCTWLDEKFLSSCLLDGKDHEGIIKSFSTSPVAPPGVGYSSLIVRVNVELEKKNPSRTEKISIIVKGPLEKVTGNLYKTESTFYSEFIPAALGISQSINFAPKSYHSPIEDVVVMEDLKREGYLLVDKRKLLDFDHCTLYAQASANLHAVSMAVHSKYPELVESLGKEKFLSNDLLSSVGLRNLTKGGLVYLAERMSKIEEYKRYAPVIRDNAITIWDMMIESVKPDATFNALCQADPWIANMMFKYDNCGKVLNIKLLDFQGLRYASPVCDLIFFIWSSSNHNVRDSKLQEFYRIYCDTLNAKLEEYDCPARLTFQQLMEHVRRFSFKALNVASTTFPILGCPSMVDTTSLIFGDSSENLIREAFDQCYDSEYCELHLPRILKQLKATGVLDYVEKHLTAK